MSHTPRTDDAEEQSIRAYEAERESGWPPFPCDGYDFARELERELVAAKARIATLEDYTHGLEVIGDDMKQAALTCDAVKWDAQRAGRPQP